jgi:hypothetical protein
MKRSILAILAVGAVMLLTFVPATVASAGGPYYVAWTRIGIYPRTSPEMRSDNKAGPAVPDGTPLTIICESTGQTVTSDVATTDIWESTTIGWIPNAFVETGANGFTPGIPRCGSAAPQPQPQPQQPQQPAPQQPTPQQPTPQQPAAPAPVPEVPYDVGSGVKLQGHDGAAILYGWWVGKQGGTVILDWSYFQSFPRLMDFARSLPIDSLGKQFTTDANDGDLFFALHNFSIARTSEHCWAVSDSYDFDIGIDHLEKIPQNILPFVFVKLMDKAVNFTVRSSGCTF